MEATRTTHAMDHPLLTRSLEQDGAFVRLLARSLVRDSERADDLVQETWLRFLERTPSRAGNLRHWFRTVARNLAASGARGERNRSEREASAARPEALPSAADDFEHAELMRSVIDAVLTLEEPYRATLLARYYRGWSARRIASETRTPIATVRSREQRALEQLRAKLDRQTGGRAAWGLALGKLLALKPALALPAGSTLAAGLGLAAGVALVAGLAWNASRGAKGSVAPSPQPAQVAESEPNGLHATMSVREAVAAPQTNTPPPGPGAQPMLAVPPSEIRARFVFSDGTPAAGVAAELKLEGAIQRNGVESQEEEPPVWEDQNATSGSDGRVSFTFSKPSDHFLALVAKLPEHATISWGWSDVSPGSVLDLGDVAVLRACVVTGRLVRPGGAPILGESWRINDASMGLSDRNGRTETRVHAALDTATGTFRLEGLAPGTNALQAQNELAGQVNGPRVTLEEGGTAAVDFVYDGPDSSRRILVDVEMRRFRAVERASADHIWLLTGLAAARNPVKTPNSWMSFVFDDLEPGDYTIEIDDPRCVLWRQEGVHPGTRVRAQLEGNSALVLAVTDAATGLPVAGFQAQVTLRNVNSFPNTFDAGPLVGGRISGLFSGDSTIEVRAGELVGSANVDALAVGETRTVAIEVAPRASVAGIARFADGAPAAGFRATLLRPALSGDSNASSILRLGYHTTDDSDQRVEVAATDVDAAGHFTLVAPRVGDYLVRVCNGAGTETFSAILPLAGESRDDLELVLARPGALAGHLLVPDGASVACLRVRAYPSGIDYRRSDELESQGAELGADGHFALPSLAAGPTRLYLVMPLSLRHSRGGWTGSGVGWSNDRPMFARELGQLDVPAGGTLERDFTLDDYPGTLELTVRVNGAPAPRLGLSLKADEADEGEVLEAETDDHGVLGPFPLFAGTWTVTAEDPESGWQAPNPQPLVITRARPTITTIDFTRP